MAIIQYFRKPFHDIVSVTDQDEANQTLSLFSPLLYCFMFGENCPNLKQSDQRMGTDHHTLRTLFTDSQELHLHLFRTVRSLQHTRPRYFCLLGYNAVQSVES
jgi:hypothetical protein